MQRRAPRLARPLATAAALLGLLACLLAGGPAARAATPAGPGAAAPGADPDLRRAIGAKLMGRMNGTRPSTGLLRRIRRGELGGVILFSDNVRSAAQVRSLTRSLRAAAAAGGHRPLLVAVDQEGGLVRRLPFAPPGRSPAAMARAGIAGGEGERTGRALRGLGVTIDLAPVADIAWSPRSFLGTRAFGRTPARVSRHACRFAAGLRRGGVAATAKHFPGLGHAGANTDLAVVSIRRRAGVLRRDYAPFRRCIRSAGTPLVMLSNAAYPALDPSGRPAVLSERIVHRELRGRLGFRGVTISDDLQTPALRTSRRPGLAAARAGVDILLYAGTEGASAAAFSELLAGVRAGAVSRGRVLASARRVRALATG
jgi:beta-N-acetylhexosaminidase